MTARSLLHHTFATVSLALCALACGDDSAPVDAGTAGPRVDAGQPVVDDGSVEGAPARRDAAVDAGRRDDASQASSPPTDDAGAPPAAATCKRGVAYGGHSPADMKALSASVHWWYNWSSRPEAAVASAYRGDGVEFVPMAWGRFDKAKLAAEIPDGARTLLGFNEPNFKHQANLSASDAASLWKDLQAVADAHGLELASPALNYCGPAADCWETDPFEYLDAFFAACKGCRVDYIAAHWYACDAPALQFYLGKLKAYGKPIWLTEFSCGDGDDRSLARQKTYMKDALAILEAEPQVARYSWFSARTDAIPNVALLAGDGTLTELGKLYVSLPHVDPSCAR